MKRLILPLLLTILFASIAPIVSSQDYQGKVEKIDGKLYVNGLPVISPDELKDFEDLPKLTLPDNYKTRNFPVTVDNSALPYFRPIFDQVALECGQASGVAYTFTYEIDRLRDLPANVIENQYPTHFVYNWSGNGSGTASSFFDSWNIIKYAGTPNVLDYGGSLSYGGSARWLNGYDLYYRALQNRLWDFYSIDVTTVEGLTTLRQWIDNHLDGSETGGIGNIYTSAIGANNTLPAGTPEAGKKVILNLVTSANHALCVVGYHDSIRYDWNNDGQYTNDLDITGDGVVDIKDWEIGGVKLANSYYASSWGDAGFSYLLYRGLCKTLPESGCWNGCVNVIKAKENTEPQITYKVTLTHDSRNKIKVMAGVATTPGATEPEHIIDFPIFNYQGGDKYMTGGTSTEDKTLEFGLDVTRLLAFVEDGQTARYFLLVDENDPSNLGTGLINSFSLMDYTIGGVETQCSQTNVPLNENGLCTIYLDASVSFDNPEVLNVELPTAVVNEPYNEQMIGTNGTEPYQWKVKQNYTVQEGTNTYPAITQEPLFPTNQTSGYATKEIEFDFPFYGKTYNEITMHTDGYLMFKEDHYPWTFLVNQANLFKNMRNISPMMSSTLGVTGGGMWYEGNSTKASFRWKTTEYSTGNTQDFAVSLYPSGRIELFYDDCTIASWNPWFAGICEGDDFNYEMLDISNTSIEPNTMITLEPDYNLTELSITEDGLYKGLPTHPYEAVEVEFYLKDANGLQNTKELLLSTDGVNNIVIRDVFVQSGDNSVIEYGETATLSVELKNIGDVTVNASEMKIASNDMYISIIDSLATLGTFEPGETIVIENAFQFEVSTEVPNGHDLVFSTAIQAESDVYNSYIYLRAYAPSLLIGNVTMDDGNNGYPEPGETVAVFVNVKNVGGGKAYNIETELTNSDPFISITSGNFTIPFINGSSTATAEFEIYIDPSTPLGYSSAFNVAADADFGFSTEGSFGISIGFILEDFETGNFSQYDWEFSGDADWLIDDFDPYEGAYCIKSGDIGDDQSSTVSMTMDVLIDNEISFYYKVSSEPSYDYLRFYIDGTQMGQWSGEEGWGLATYPVTAGERTFSWAFEKDYSVSNGFDAGYVDYILFPPSGQQGMAVSAGPDMSICENQTATLQAFIINSQNIEWVTSGDGVFDDNSLVNPTYTPGAQDINTGNAELMVTAWDNENNPMTDNMQVFIDHLPIVFAGNDEEVCDNAGVISLTGLVINTPNYFWGTSGDGTFSNFTLLETNYYPGEEDLSTGSTTLSLTGMGLPPCTGPLADQMEITFIPAPLVTFDELPLLGLNSPPYQIIEGSPAGGEYEGPGVTDGVLYPEVAGVGTHLLTYNYTGANNCTESAERYVQIDEWVGIPVTEIQGINIMPNPNKGRFSIYPDEKFDGNVKVELYSTSGKIVYEKSFTQYISGTKLEIDCAGQPGGVYYLKLICNDKIMTRKLIIN